jgi:aldehyde:ferredoxin oxidoreductase
MASLQYGSLYALSNHPFSEIPSHIMNTDTDVPQYEFQPQEMRGYQQPYHVENIPQKLYKSVRYKDAINQTILCNFVSMILQTEMITPVK